MANVKRIVIDMLKPHELSTVELTKGLSELDSIDSVDVAITHVERDVEKAKATVVGENISFEAVEDFIQQSGATIHGIDKVTAGKHLIDEVQTPQDTK